MMSSKEQARIIAQMNHKPKELIETVKFVPELIGQGMCGRCHKPAEQLLRIKALIYYKDETGLMIETVWEIRYCVWCIGDITGTLPEEQLEGLYE
ncbi:hypothetical protein KAU51_01980 [Candidatus Parcubacteria bacterium]|nr:hypothetical protein [Candidatus Parcubacteria bacterium]